MNSCPKNWANSEQKGAEMNNQIQFTKMQGLGNDFMVVETLNQSVPLDTQRIQHWADRHFGIGFDQLLVVESTSTKGVDFRYRIFNADGSEVQQCGNGARCFARFVADKGLTNKRDITVETASGIIVLHLVENRMVKVNMGCPNLAPSSLPFEADNMSQTYAVAVDGEPHEVVLSAVSMGNPHAVLEVESVDAVPVDRLGEKLERHPRFPERVNVGFAQVVDRSHIRLRVYERGAAETLACGTGACAAMVAMRNLGKVGDQVEVTLPGGTLQIEWNGDTQQPLWMTGPAETVFEGVIAG